MADKANFLKLSKIYGWHVYVLEEDGGAFSKIGTAYRVDFRISGLGNGNPRRLILRSSWHVASRDFAFRVEHMALKSCQTRIHRRDWINGNADAAIAAVVSAINALSVRAAA